jgi:hypothetical protein
MRTKEQRKRHVQYLARTVQPIGEWGHGPGRGHKALKTRRKPKVKGSGGQKYLRNREQNQPLSYNLDLHPTLNMLTYCFYSSFWGNLHPVSSWQDGQLGGLQIGDE